MKLLFINIITQVAKLNSKLKEGRESNKIFDQMENERMQI